MLALCCFDTRLRSRGRVARLELYTTTTTMSVSDCFSSLCLRHILVSVRCSLFDQHVSRRLPEHLPSVLHGIGSGYEQARDLWTAQAKHDNTLEPLLAATRALQD